MNNNLKNLFMVLGVVFLCVASLCVFAIVFSPDAAFVSVATPTQEEKPIAKPTIKPTATVSPTRTPRPTATPMYGSRKNPVGFGDSILIGDEKYSYVEIVVIDVVRGADAWLAIKDSNMFNEPPADEMEYLVATVEISYLEESDELGEIWEISQAFWSVVTNGQVFDWFSSSSPCCFDDAKVIVGGVASMTTANQVYINDENPYLVFMDKFFFSTR